MTLWSRLRSWLLAIVGRSRMEREMDAELRFHTEAFAEDLMSSGMPREEALRRARIEFGGIERAKEECRDTLGVNFVENLLQDLRFGLRMLRKAPGFTAVVVSTLALGIGANTAIFNFVDALMLQRLPVPRPEELYSFTRGTSQQKGESFSYPEFAFLSETKGSMGQLFGYAYRTVRVGSAPQIQNVSVQLVSNQYFAALAQGAALGRTLDEAGPDTAGALIAVISDRYWQRHFDRSPASLGRSLDINGHEFTIIGIMPPGFAGVSLDYDPDVWLPLADQPQLDGTSLLAATGTHWVRVMTRLPSDLSERKASAQATTLIKQGSSALNQEAPRVDLIPAARPDSGLRQPLGSPLLLLLAIVAVLLLVACINVAHLLQARSASRRHEFSVRIAIGAGRGRLMRQLLTENVVLSGIGGALAISLAWAASRVLTGYIARAGMLPAALLDSLAFRPNGHVLLFVASLAIAVGALVGLAPAQRAADMDLTSALKNSAPSSLGATHQRGRWLVAMQVAASLLLLSVAGLFIRSFQRLNEIDLGFSPAGVFQLQIDWAGLTYTDDQIRSLADQLVDRFRIMPGVSSVSLSVPGVFSRSTWQTTFQREGQPPDQAVLVNITSASSGFFRTLGIPLLLGRDFTPLDRKDTRRVVILSERMARAYFQGLNPIGQHVLVQGESVPAEVVGVANDIRLRSVLASPPSLVYVPLAQSKGRVARFMTWEIRSSLSSSLLAAAIAQHVHSLNPELTVDVQPVVTTIAHSILLQQLAAWLTSLFGLLGLALSAIGMYGLLSYLVMQRTPEMGVRLALGARPSEVLWLVWRESMGPVAVGAAAGMLAAIATTRLLVSYSFGLAGAAPVAVAVSLCLMLSVAGLACYLPALRASRIDPMVALRYE